MHEYEDTRMSSRLAAFLARITAIAALAAVVQGCDFVRTVLGRPDSAEVEHARQVRLSRQEQRRQARLEAERRRADSLAAVSDSLFVVSAAEQRGIVFKRLSSLKSVPTEIPDFRYCLMMGYFSMKDNALRLASRMEADGQEPLLIGFTSGATGVALFPSDMAQETVGGMETVRGKEYFPEDSWIIINDLGAVQQQDDKSNNSLLN